MRPVHATGAGVSDRRERLPVRLLRTVAESTGVRPGEEGALVAAALFQLSFVAGAALLKAASYALLLHQVEDRRVLPALYVVSSLTVGALAVGQVLWRPQRRWPPQRTLLGWIGIFLTLSLLILVYGPLATVALYLFVELYTTTVSVRFWTQVSDRFDLRAARRLLGIIGGVGMGGSILGGFVAQAFGGALGALPLVAIACLSPLACLYLAPAMAVDFDRDPSERPAAPPKADSAAMRGYLLRDMLPRSLAVLVLLFAAVSTASDYLFRYRARESLGEGEMAALFGGMSMLVGAVAMAVQLLFTGKLLRRIGLFGFLSIIPALGLAFAAAGILTPALWPAYGLRMVEQIGSLALLQTGVQLLYGPVPDAMRAAVRSAVDGLAKKTGHALVGLALVAFASTLHPGGFELPLAIFGLLLVSLWALLRVRRHYVGALSDRLRGAELSSHEDLVLPNATAQAVLEEALEGEDEGGVLTALELLSRDPDARIESHLLRLLDHPSPRVQLTAAVLATDRNAQTCAVRLGELTASDDRELREAAIFGVARLRPATAATTLVPLLDHPEPSTRVAAIAALLPLEGAGPANQAMEAMLGRGANASEEERIAAAQLLGTLGPGRHAIRLRAYLRDASVEVRRAACAAAGECRDQRLVPELFTLLVERDTKPHARTALARYGDAITHVIESLLNDRHQSLELRYRLPRLLREIGTERAAEVILFSNVEDDPFLQYRLCMAVGLLCERNPHVRIDRTRALDATGRRLSAYEQLVPVARDLEAALGKNDLLVRALHDRLDQCLEGAFRLVALVFPRRKVANAFNRFINGDARTRPFAIEMLEHLIQDGVSRRFVAALERWHRLPDHDGAGRIERVPARFMELLVSRDPVLRAIAVTTVKQLAALRPGEGEAPLPEAYRARFKRLEAHVDDPMWQSLLNAPLNLYREESVSEQVVEKILFLEGVDIFAESDVDDLAALAKLLRERSYRAGETVYLEDDPGDAVFIIVEGRVRIEKDGRQLMDFGPRDSFGETSLLDGKPRPAGAVAVTDLRVYVLERSDFLDLVADRVELLRGIFRAVTRHLRLVLDSMAAGRNTNPSLPPVPASSLKSEAS